MPIKDRLKSGLLVAALAGGCGALVPAEAEEERRRREHPAGWRVRVSPDPILAKQGFYAFNVTVRDENGKPVDHAEVFLQLRSHREPGYRLLPAQRAGRGWYRGSGHLQRGVEDPRHVRAVVRPAGRAAR